MLIRGAPTKFTVSNALPYSDSEDLIARTTIVGIIMAFRKLTLEALNSVLENRIPFLLSSVTDFKKNIPDKSSNVSPPYMEPLFHSWYRDRVETLDAHEY